VKEGFRLLSAPESQPDIAFLDIELADGSVFEVLDQLEEINFELIFITSYNQYARQACEYGSIGYLLKPIDPEVLKKAIQRIRPGKKYWNRKRVKVFESHFLRHPNPSKPMVIASATGWHFLHVCDIVYLQGEGNCTRFILKNKKKLFVTRTLGDYEELLAPLHFYRIHKSYVINLNEVEFCNNRDSFVVMKNGDRLDISRRRRPFFLAVIRRWNKLPPLENGGFEPLDG